VSERHSYDERWGWYASMGGPNSYFGNDALIHPGAPDGGTGRGYAYAPSDVRGYRELSAAPHPSSPAARGWEWGDLVGLDLLDRAEQVYAALEIAEQLAPRAILEETGEELAEIARGLIPGLLLCLAVVATTTALGGAAGAALGALAFGWGAIPAGLFGAELGAEAGLLLLEGIGLAALVGVVGVHFWRAIELAGEGVLEAWHAPDHPQQRGSRVHHAGETIAKAFGVFMRGILQGIVALLISKGAEAAASRVPAIAAELRQSRLGEQFAAWIESSWARLLKNPKLREEAPPMTPGAKEGGASAPESGAPKPRAEPDAPTPREEVAPAERPDEESAVQPPKDHTKPSKEPDPNAKPSGPRTKVHGDEATQRSLKRENDSADILARNGYDVEQNPKTPGPKNPDYKIEGETFDCYSPGATKSPRGISSELEGKVDKGQADRFVVNGQDWNGDPAALTQQLNDYPVEGLKEVIFIDKAETVTHIYP
jgi:hypothetical protein